jgi:glucosamine-6-phosphate deaminase
MRELKVDKLPVKIYNDRKTMGGDAASMVVQKINELLSQQNYVNIIFAAAPSQDEFLAFLKKSGVDWSRINAFHMDEYVGLDAAAPQRFGNFLKKSLFDEVALRSVHYLDGNATNLEEECKRYSDLLTVFPADIVCMGIGENGHIAFNDPPVADFKDQQLVKVVELDEPCRQQQVNDGCFSTFNNVPAYALTLTIPALMAGKYIYCMVPGERKAEAVYNTLHKEIVEQYPSTILRSHQHAILYLDEQSGSLLY